MRLKCIIYFLVCCIQTSYAQSVKFDRLSIEDGLSQNSVLAVCEDKDGFIWLGTRDGLNKYNSYDFKIYKSHPANKSSLQSSYITNLYCDSKNRLWVGTSKGLNIYDRTLDAYKRVPLLFKNGEDINLSRINSILEDRTGRLWVASEYDLNLIQANGRLKHIVPVNPITNRMVLRSLCQDHTGTIWLGTTHGIYTVAEKQKRFWVEKFLPLATAGLADAPIMSVTEDTAHNLWIATSGKGLYKYEPALRAIKHYTTSGKPDSLSDDNVRRLLPDGKGNLWIGTQTGLSLYNAFTKKFSNYRNDPWDNTSLSQNSVHSLYKDHAGIIWVGTFFGGVNRIYPYPAPFSVISNRSFTAALNNNVISSILKDAQGYLWIGTEGGGINVVAPNGLHTKVYQHVTGAPHTLGSNLVKVIFKDSFNQIWVGTHGGGLNLFDAGINGFKQYLNHNQATLGSEITCLAEDNAKRLWIGTETAGLNVFENNNGNLIKVNDAKITRLTKNRSILSVIKDDDGKIWAGGPDGLYITDAKGVVYIKKIPRDRPLAVNCIFQDSLKNVWVGTNALGLVKFSKNGHFIRNYTVDNELSDNKVLGILQNGNDLWISTGNGLNRLNLNSNTINHYFETDGLAGNIFNNNSYYRATNGLMYFGGYNGLTIFNPNSIRINKQAPVVRLTSLSVHNKKVVPGDRNSILKQNINLTKQITLNHDQNVFTVQFAVLNFIKPEKNKYRYYLEGYDKDWQSVNSPVATYTNVPPGHYRFYVSGCNNDNVWSNKLSLQIDIRPPVWRAWWAYMLYFILLTGLVTLVVRYLFIRALYKKEQELTRLKLNFFTNISHEIRTHLALITGPANKLIADNEPLLKGKQQLVTIKNNSESLLQLVNELLDFRKAETGHLNLRITLVDIVDFIGNVKTNFNEIAAEKNIVFELQASASRIDMYFDREQMEKVFYNLLYNAFKFTPGGGFVSVIIKNEKDDVVIDFVNSGPGIAKENIDKLFENYFQEIDYGKQNTGYGIGLALSKSIVDLHGGSIKVESSAHENGQSLTKFTIKLKNGAGHFSARQIKQGQLSYANAVNIPATRNEHEQADYSLSPLYNHKDLVPDEEKLTILLVEDNPDMRGFIKSILQPRYTIIEACNGLEGFDVATLEIPDLVISDVMMPEMDGLTFCAKIKSDERTSHIPVILLTAQSSVQHHVNGLQTGADIYLTKPFSSDVLMLQVNNLISARELIWHKLNREFKLHIKKLNLTDEDKAVDKQTVHLHPLDEAFLDRITNMVNENLMNRNFGVQQLSQMAGMSQPVLFRKIKGITGLSANDFVKSLRLKKAAELLLDGHYNVSEISNIVGYESSKYFSREFKKSYGVNPSAYTKDSAINNEQVNNHQ
ncbi:two-component regulator propeller domain-containing protein [Mucilaginibacter sp. PAMB04168]|uniref:hybrid sensor histidine kinase/response regulator transcription factor n=1 Tax=Mucilaginibacter sp. PAMB04168 TaxID=3138567 RepID=UPI0031F72173